MADIATTREMILLCREASISLFLWGSHGIGKSSVVRQVAAQQGIRFVDMRCAQLEASDLRGFPDKGSDGRTHFLPPADMPHDGDGILLLDELNRANTDVLAAAFQLVLDRSIGQYRLPTGWSIVCAGNHSNDDYTVTEFDPAFRDRFCHLQVSSGEVTFHEWVDWMTSEHASDARTVIDFCAMNLDNLERTGSENLGFQVEPSRRSWDLAVRGLKTWSRGGFSERTRLELVAGLVGRDLAVAFVNHRPSISPECLLKKGVSAIRGELNSLSSNQLSSLMWGVSTFTSCRSDDAALTEPVLDFAEYLAGRESDLCVAFFSIITTRGKSRREAVENAIQLSNSRLAVAMERIRANAGGADGFMSHLSRRPALAKSLASMMNGTQAQVNGSP